MIRARVITCSDSSFRAEREDRSGPALRALLTHAGFDVDVVAIVPDDVERIATAILDGIAHGNRLIVTTGGTGIAARDVTPEATMRIAERTVPGFGELMRSASLQKTPMGALSRVQAVTRGNALIINVPGSPRGAVENLEAVLHLVPHALELLEGKTQHERPAGT